MNIKAKISVQFAPLLKSIEQTLWLWGILSHAAYDVDYWTIPLPAPKKKPVPKMGKAANLDDKIFVPGAAYESKSVENESNAIELTNLKYKKELAKELTKVDIDQLQLEGLDLTSDEALAKAAEIKRLFVKAETIGDIVNHFNGRRGYSRTTIKKYVKAFQSSMVGQK